MHEQAGRIRDALRCRQRAISADPRHFGYWIKLARLHHERLQEPHLAIQALKKVLEVEPNHAETLALLMEIERAAAAPRGPNTAHAGPGTPLVSAIVSTYNSARFLRGCLEDLERQTIADQLEIIVVDSASPQNERAIVEEFQQRYSNIVYLRTETRETVYGAWNRGIRAARGKYLTNANTDDRHRPDALDILARTLEANPDITLAYADCLVTRVENETFETTRATERMQWLDFNPADLLLKGCFVGPQPMWRREVHDEHGYFDATIVSAGDYEFWLRLAQNRTFFHVKETLGLYLESPTSVEHGNRERGAKEVLEARRRYNAVLTSGARPIRAPVAKPVAPWQGRPHSSARPPRAVAAITLPAAAMVGHLDAARELLERKKLREAWEAARAAIAARPFHPEAFLLLAEIAQAAGDSVSARTCAQHACGSRRNGSRRNNFSKAICAATRSPTGSRCRKTLRTPHSAIRTRLTVCLIVKNEEKFLGQCLDSVRGLADQIVVVDTGSTDRTVDIAREHGAEVHTFAWCDDFSAARNAALEHATGDWILMLDADEELPPKPRTVAQTAAG